MSKADYAFGRSKVFIRNPRTVLELEEKRKVRINELAGESASRLRVFIRVYIPWQLSYSLHVFLGAASLEHDESDSIVNYVDLQPETSLLFMYTTLTRSISLAHLHSQAAVSV